MASIPLAEELPRWLAALFTSVLAAFLASALTLRRVKREKRWEARHEAYRCILRSIHDIRFWADEAYADAMLLPSVGTAKQQELRNQYDNAKHELWAQVHVGQLTISQRCREALEALLSAIASEEHRFDQDSRGEDEYSEDLSHHCDRLRSLVDGALPEILTAATKDLR